MVLRDSHVASLLGMTNLGHCANELMPQIMPACKAVTDRRYRRNCFNAAQYGSAVRCRARHASPRLVKKVPSGLFSPSCFPNCKIKFCSMILQFCRCGGGSNAKGHSDGFLSHFPSLRNFQLSVILTICVPPFLLYRKTPQSTTGKQAGPGALQRLILPLTFSGRHGIMGTR